MLIEKELTAGVYIFDFNAIGLPVKLIFTTLHAGNVVDTRKMKVMM